MIDGQLRLPLSLKRPAAPSANPTCHPSLSPHAVLHFPLSVTRHRGRRRHATFAVDLEPRRPCPRLRRDPRILLAR
jgi:hypothetical protein